MLRDVGCPFTSVRREGLEGEQDFELITWIGKRGFVWVTNDHAARNEHEKIIVNEGISVVWVRGIQRRNRGNTRRILSNKDLLHLLVSKVDRIVQVIRDAKEPVYFLLQLYGDSPRLFSILRHPGRRQAKARAVSRRLSFRRVQNFQNLISHVQLRSPFGNHPYSSRRGQSVQSSARARRRHAQNFPGPRGRHERIGEEFVD